MDTMIDPVLFGLLRTAGVKSVTTLPTAEARLMGTIYHRDTDNTFWNVAADGVTWESAAAKARAALGANSATQALTPAASVDIDWTPATPDMTLTLDQATELSKGTNWPTNNSGSVAMRIHIDRTTDLYTIDITTSLVEREIGDQLPSDARYFTLCLSVENSEIIGSWRPGRS